MVDSFKVVLVGFILALLYFILRDILSDYDSFGFVLDYLIGFVSEIEDRINALLYELARRWRENT